MNTGEKLGYIQGVLEEVRDDVKLSRTEFVQALRDLRREFHEHTQADAVQFKKLDDYQKKQKWIIAGAVGVCSVLAATAGVAVKIIGVF